MDLNLQLIAICGFIWTFLYFALLSRRRITTRSNGKKAPEPAGAWPIIGHLHLLGGSDQLLHHTLGMMADKYGPAFKLPCFCGCYSHWRAMRKIVTLELLSNCRLEMVKHVQASEVDLGIRKLYGLWAENKDHRIVAGKCFSGGSDDGEARWCQKTIAAFFHMMGIFVVSDALPFLRWLDLQGHERAMKKTAKDMDAILEGWLGEHHRENASGMFEAEDKQDFMDVMLLLEEEGRLSGFPYDENTSIKATCLACQLNRLS
ncbi:conserved hypothetical protein [Ricinus communis]|uniref:Cytochrome P450 n=1 Tax=Ricinus communis TaxID=3988 RepID=B9R7K6_RICCO|nr:conserved hypothetical protein [Ricinus communis]